MSFFELKNGEKLYYEDTVEGEQTLVMLHGWTSSHDVYSIPVQTLKQKARCITYDHRGHGGSKEANKDHVDMITLASDLHELLTGLGLDDVTLFGWSMGAGVVMTYLEEYGTEKLKQVVLCDMTPRQRNDEEWQLGLYQGRYSDEDAEKEAGKSFFDLYKEFAVGAMPKLKNIPAVFVDPELKKIICNCDPGVLISLSKSMKAQDHRDCFKDLDVPLTYFYADPGSLFSPKLADWYRENVPTEFKAVRFENATHMLIDEHPQKFISEVAALL